MKYPERTIRSVSDMVKALNRQESNSGITWFRGQSNQDWNLVPSLARKPSHLRAEGAVTKRFMQNALPHLNALPREEWEWMFLMQHHRAPTRLLDWTESPLAALYFSVDSNRRTDGAVWCIDPIALNRAARLTFTFESEIPAFGTDDVLKNYLPSRVAESPSELVPIAVIGPRNTPRMAAQLGTFTISHRLHTPIELIDNRSHVWRWRIPQPAKRQIKSELARLAFTKLTLFPELDHVADLSRELLR
jgi:FRG domain